MRWVRLIRLMAACAVVVVVWQSLNSLGAPPPNGVPAAGPAAAKPPEEAPGPPAEGFERPKPSEITVWYLIQAGGPLMWPIGFCSVVALAFIIERLVRLRRRHVIPAGFVRGLSDVVNGGAVDSGRAIELCRQHPSPAARIFEGAFKRAGRPHRDIEKVVEDAGVREVQRLKQNIRMLSLMANVAPLLGLLGTVTGIIKAFIKVHTEKGMGKPELLAAGIYEALVTTAAGLFVAIPAVAMYHYFTHKVDKMVGEIDAMAEDVVEAIAVAER